MAHPYHHALSSVKKWGGTVEDYQPLHSWYDSSKAHSADFRHRVRIPGPSGRGFRFDPVIRSNLIQSPIPGHPVTLFG